MIVFSDMDGTFLTSRKEVSARNLAALDALASAGMAFVPCTGRPLQGILPELMNHPSVHHAICANGAAIFELDPQNRTLAAARRIHQVTLPRARARAIWDVARGRDVTFDIFADGHCYLRRDLYERIGEFVSDPFVAQSMAQNRIPVDTDPAETLANVQVLERVSVYWRDPRDRDEILAGLAGIDGIEVTRSFPTNIEIMGTGASKGAALTWLCDHLDIPVGEAVAFGDNQNDISMIEAAGTGVAVANAEPEVRDAADAICASNDENGVGAFILERLGASAA